MKCSYRDVCCRLLEADREMARRKEVSRQELADRRMKRGEKRAFSPDNNQDPSIVLSDETMSPDQSDDDDDDQSNSDE